MLGATVQTKRSSASDNLFLQEAWAEADARAVGATLLERAEEIAGARPRQAAARILDFDEDAIRSSIYGTSDFSHDCSPEPAPMQGFPGTEDAHSCSIRRTEGFPLRAWREKEILVGIFDGFGKKEEKPKADFSNVQSGSSTTAPAPAAEAPVPDLGPASGTSGSEQSYTVVAGDSLSKIAKHFYGDANKWPRIHEANRDQIKNPDLIYPGQKLRIPAA
jgi:hypothetical protein